MTNYVDINLQLKWLADNQVHGYITAFVDESI